jgi:hypothetical protein
MGMAEIVGSFTHGKLSFSWVNAIVKFGYVMITSATPDADFIAMWDSGTHVQKFLQENPTTKADEVGLLYLELPNQPPTLSVLPRYVHDFDNSNALYNQVELPDPPKYSTSDVLAPLVRQLREYLAEHLLVD